VGAATLAGEGSSIWSLAEEDPWEGWPSPLTRRAVKFEPLPVRRRAWNGDHCFALDYPAGAAGRGDPRRALIQAFKKGDIYAIAVARHLLLHAVVQQQPTLARAGSSWLVVAAPGHAPGSGSPLESLCAGLSAAVPWLAYRPGLISRRRWIRQSSASLHRPTIEEHIETLECAPAAAHKRILIIDDVYTRGNTTAACREMLFEAKATSILIACLSLTRT
jgi:predicted amidophosphoribosyltransferase